MIRFQQKSIHNFTFWKFLQHTEACSWITYLVFSFTNLKKDKEQKNQHFQKNILSSWRSKFDQVGFPQNFWVHTAHNYEKSTMFYSIFIQYYFSDNFYFIFQPKHQSCVHLVCSRPTSHALQILRSLLFTAPKNIRLKPDLVCITIPFFFKFDTQLARI